VIENNLLSLTNSKCRDCYKCLRECPVKAIKVVDSQARIIGSRCILCGKCSIICPQNAKLIHSETPIIRKILNEGNIVIALVDLSYISSFGLENFNIAKDALLKIGFSDAYDLSYGSAIYSKKIQEIIKSGTYKNIITSTCPSVNKIIELYYHSALPFLVPIQSPMVIQANYVKSIYPNAKVVYIGPCISRKLEASESKVIDAVLTFEQLLNLMGDYEVEFDKSKESSDVYPNNIVKSLYFPISRGVMKSFDEINPKYEYMVIDGINKCIEVLENINSCENLYLEMTSCEYSCINGPCSLVGNLEAINANAFLRKYVKQLRTSEKSITLPCFDVTTERKPKVINELVPTEDEINEILSRIGKHKVSDQLNCGACGYASCREKAIAVFNGYASSEMCVPYMRERAESMSYEVIQRSPNGIVLLDSELKVSECNDKFKEMFSLTNVKIKGKLATEFFDTSKYYEVLTNKVEFINQKEYVKTTNKYLESSIISLPKEKMVFGLYTDITSKTLIENELDSIKLKTAETADEVINKQMAVAQEIASLLGTITAESKVALINLKKVLIKNDIKD
jgi:iron only hydrogenase large subunit-like protein/uncharacterized Fe-S cluster-containing protein